jgi:hypothetical protein
MLDKPVLFLVDTVWRDEAERVPTQPWRPAVHDACQRISSWTA